MNFNRTLLEMDTVTWKGLMADLCQRGGARRESGAFLLGVASGGIRRVKGWIPYDELDGEALTEGYVRLGTQAFTELWKRCAELQVEVVADVHTHPENPRQSKSDRTNPMIAQPGHLALIVPNYAQGLVTPRTISVNVYQGSKRWTQFFGPDAEALVRLT